MDSFFSPQTKTNKDEERKKGKCIESQLKHTSRPGISEREKNNQNVNAQD